MILLSKTANVNEIGGKAFNLFNLQIKNTPDLRVVPASFFADLKNDKVNISVLKEELNSWLKDNKLYAVRSSAIDEDSQTSSFAGVHDSFLNVKKQDVFDKIEQVYKSAFSDRALEYRKLKGLPCSNIKIAVIVQEMVNADFAGVAFTINPITDNPDEIIVSVTKGLGEQLVSGQVSGTTYTVSGNAFSTTNEDILNNKQKNALVDMINQIIAKTTAFQDIEFAIKGNKVYFLQARPIVSYKNVNPHSRDLLIDNSNIVESYFGYTSYLTYTFAKDVYRDVYTATLNLGKLRKKIMSGLAPSLSNMLYYYEGNIYYNMKSWYFVNSVFPFKKSTSYMENMMGVKSKSGKFKRVKMNILDMLKLGVLFIDKVKKLDKLSNCFVENFNRIVGPYYGKKIEGTNEELNALFKSIEKDIVKEFAIPVINDCALMIYFGLLKERAKKFGISEEQLNLYVNNNGEVESAGSAIQLIDIVEQICASEGLKNDFLTLSPDDLCQKYANESELSKAINEYRLKYGARVRDELKLESVTMIEDENLVFALIKESLSLKPIKSKASDQVQIPNKLKKLAQKTRKYVQNRERLRLYRTYVYSVVRNIFLAFANNYYNEGRIDDITDIFYLSKEEVLSGKGDFKRLILERKKQKEEWKNKPYYKRIVFFNGKPMPVKYFKAGNGLKGIPSGCGKVKANVSLLNDASDNLKAGNIILTKRTDPGWIGLFPKASGLIVENGSMLSHSFVVARELGLPAVVGVENATTLIKDGALVTLDGDKGEVIIED